MSLSRGVILITSLMLGIFGLLTLIKPTIMMAQMGIQSPTTNALSEFRTISGGIAFGLSCFLFYALGDKALERPALLLTASILSFASLGRMVSLIIDGTPSNQFVVAFVIEIIGALLAVVCLRRQKFNK